MDKKIIFKQAIGGCVHYFKTHTNSPTEKGCRVLMYHSISDGFLLEDSYQMTTPLPLFEAQMAFLYENNYHIISSDHMTDVLMKKKTFLDKTVVLTFDDGFKDNLKVLQVLEKYCFPATIFVTVSYLDQEPVYLSSKDIKFLCDSKLVTIGSHTLSHRLLKVLSDSDLEKEIILSKKILENMISKPVTLFAYPFGAYGAYDKRIVRFVEQAGYKAAFSTIAGINELHQDRYQIKRTRISRLDILPEFQKELLGAYDWYKLWQRMSTILPSRG